METEAEYRPLGFSALPRRQVMFTFGGVLMAMFLGAVSQTVIGPAMPRIIADLGGFQQYTWVAIAHTVASAVAIPVVGKLTDMYGRKYFYLGGIAIYTLASLLSGLSTSMNQLIIFRALAGIGGGAMMSNAITVIGDLFPPAERGKYQGFTSGVFGLSSVLGPTLGGFLTDTLSWRWVFLFSVPLGLLVIIVFIFVFPPVRPDNLEHKIDYAGLMTLVLAIVSLMLALSLARVEYAWDSPQMLGMFGFAAVMLIVFVLIERRAQEPILPLWIFRNSIISVSAVVVFVTGLGMFGSLIFLPLFFQGVLGVTATVSGSFMIPMNLALIAGSFASGQLLSRARGHYRIQGTVGIVIMGIGIWLLARMNTATQYSTAVAYTVLTGFGLGITMPLYTIAVQNAVPYSVLGVATSSTMFFRSIGGSVGLALLGSVMSGRFASELTARLPAGIVGMIPPQAISSLANNPQALVSPEAQARLQAMFSRMGAAGSALYEQTFQALRESLSSAISEAFLVAFVVLAIAFVVNFFLKEIPLRKQHTNEMSFPQRKRREN